MSGINVEIPAIISVVIFLVVAIFQLLLTFGAPLGEASWGGKHKGVLPANLRFASLVGAVLLVCMALVVLGDTDVISVGFRPPHLLLWVITGFMALNTLGNLASKSKYEKIIMTPLTGVAFVSCLLLSIH
ncbi:hypothetical protein JJB07_03825 [Tumebacillus sp. ITR2]|uniref:Integral membrane protein n=1 Tax=Tumebacillus amylolyticus TaxID=2801339 RepID=A0ABS1J685_9BACL|nr:hypothetical protein [Tumebacillus amylolyticus]MBL0385769.1 hypothetical protein [Tumebacillus amylolyticus]